MNIGKFLGKLIRNNTGISSKNFFLVTVTIIGCILLIIPGVVLLVEVINNKTITTDLSGLAAYVGSVASLFATAGLTKAWSEKFEQKKGNNLINTEIVEEEETPEDEETVEEP